MSSGMQGVQCLSCRKIPKISVPFVSALAIALLLYCGTRKLIGISNDLASITESDRDQLNSAADAYRSCLVDEIRSNPGRIWFGMKTYIKKCRQIPQAARIKTIKYQKLRNQYDVKGFIAESGSVNGSCTVVTLGVGGDIRAEKQIKELAPSCEFFGAEPIEEQGAVYETIGKVFNLAVGAENGEIDGFVRINGRYRSRTIATVALSNFLNQHVKRRHIDHLLIDCEGPEYQIIPLFSTGQSMDRSNFDICQISAEFHNPLQKYGMNRTEHEKMVEGFTKESGFLPIWEMEDEESKGGHKKGFYVNFKSDFCVNKYLL